MMGARTSRPALVGESAAVVAPVAVKLSGVLLIVVCLFTLACSDDPAKSVKIVDRPAQPAGAVTTPPPAPVQVVAPPAPPAIANAVAPPSPDLNWHPDFCRLPAEDSLGSSDFIANGPCQFQHPGVASCAAMRDDFYVALTRKARSGATVVLYLNVEYYKGPGSYDWAQMLVAVYGGANIYRWSSNNVHVTVGPDQTFVTLPRTRLEGEPIMIDCTRSGGSAVTDEYPTGSLPRFTCGGRGGTLIVNGGTTETISGTLQCAAR
jgi:hypothetical protein